MATISDLSVRVSSPSAPLLEQNSANRINDFFQLNIPFKGQIGVYLDSEEEEIYTRKTFRELIEEKEKHSLPYFLVLTEDANGNVNKFDGIAFMRAYFKFGQHQSAINRLVIENASFYKIYHLDDSIFQFFCTLKDLKNEDPEESEKRHERNFFAKYLNACDLDLDAKKRGPERCYLAYKYQEGFSLNGIKIKSNEEQARFWLDRAIEDQTPLAYKQKAFFYALGKGGYPQSKEQATYYFNLAKGMDQNGPKWT